MCRGIGVSKKPAIFLIFLLYAANSGPILLVLSAKDFQTGIRALVLLGNDSVRQNCLFGRGKSWRKKENARTRCACARRTATKSIAAITAAMRSIRILSRSNATADIRAAPIDRHGELNGVLLMRASSLSVRPGACVGRLVCGTQTAPISGDCVEPRPLVSTGMWQSSLSRRRIGSTGGRASSGFARLRSKIPRPGRFGDR